MPRLVKADAGRSYAGAGWLGLKANGAYRVRAINELPLFGTLIGLALLLGAGERDVVPRRPVELRLELAEAMRRQDQAFDTVECAPDQLDEREAVAGSTGPGRTSRPAGTRAKPARA